MLFGKANWTMIPQEGRGFYTRIFENIDGSYELKEYYRDIQTSGVLLDYTFALILILSSVASTCLNPVAFYFNYQQDAKLKLCKYLFMMLAVSDFLNNLWYPLHVAWNLVTSEVLPMARDATIVETVLGLFQPGFLGYTSFVITVYISVCRCMSIKFPFYRLPKNPVLGSLAVVEILLLLGHCFLVFGLDLKGNPQRFLYCQGAYGIADEDYNSFVPAVKIPIQLFLGLTGIIASGVTAYTLNNQDSVVRTNQSTSTMKRSAQALVFMNVGNMVSVVFLVLYAIWQANVPITNFLGACGIFIVLSAFNPIIRSAPTHFLDEVLA